MELIGNVDTTEGGSSSTEEDGSTVIVRSPPTTETMTANTTDIITKQDTVLAGQERELKRTEQFLATPYYLHCVWYYP